MANSIDYLTVTDLKNYAYCARIPYFEHCFQGIRPRTYMMDAGEDAHESERDRARRRTLSTYQLEGGQRQFNVRVTSDTLKLFGLIDELVIADDGTLYPVDYKLSEQVREPYALQLTAYALLLEEAYNTQIKTGFVYFIGQRRLKTIDIDMARRDTIHTMLVDIRRMLDEEQFPEPVKARGKCRVCEWRRFCNDVVI